MRRPQTTLAEIVEFKSRSGLRLNGLLFLSHHGAPTVVHVHGSCGNFLSFAPILKEAACLVANGINLLSINTSSRDCIVEGYKGSEYVYVGGSLSDFSQCIPDISGALDFARPFSSRVILQGHSLGCDRVVHYQVETRDWHDTILLSPCDSYQLQRRARAPESVEDQIRRLRSMHPAHPFELLAPDEYGVHLAGEDYSIPMSARALLSILDGPPLSLFRLDQPATYKMEASAYVCIGGRDALQTASSSEVFDYLATRFVGIERHLLPSSDHELEPGADQMFVSISRWIANDECRRQ